MGPLLQEAHFACFDDVDDNLSSGESSLPTFVIPSPFACSQPLRSATAHASKCHASGSFFFQNESLRDRFVCWRVVKNVLLLREWSLHTTLTQNGIRLEFPAPIVASGVFAGERWKGELTEGDDTVTINVVTHAATIHRFTYSMPSSQKLSIFSESDVNALPEPKPATYSRCDMLQSLNCNETLTAAFWVNEYTVVLGTDAGHVVGVNFGLFGESNELREFVFSDRSMVSWLWQRLVQSAAIKLTGSVEDRAKQKIGAAILAVTCFQIDEDDDNTDEDICVVTISADGVLKAWSFSAQSCIGRQQLRTLMTTESDGCAGEIEERGWNDEDMISNDGDRSSSTGTYATHAKVIALSPTESDNCRLLVHLDISAAHSPEIYLLRGDVQFATVSHGGPCGGELALSIARIFAVKPPEQKMKRGLKMVDFAVDKDLLISSWRSLEGDEVYIHPNPMALTGPKRVLGQLVSSLDVQMQKYEVEDSDWPFDVNGEDAVTQIDDFFVERVLLPGRFSRQNLLNAIEEVKNGALDSSSFHFPFDRCLRKHKDVLIHLVSSRCTESAGAAVICNRLAPNMQRIMIWKELIALCSKYWRGANTPIGFATTTNALLPGAPVMLRRNRVSLLFPSAPLLTAAFTMQVDQVSTRKDCVAALVSEVLPIFDAFPSQKFQSFIQREVTDVAVDQKVESAVALARHCVSLGLESNMPAIAGRTVSADLALTRAILRFSKLLGSDGVFHNQVFRDLVEHYLPPGLRHDLGAHKTSPSKREKNLVIDNDTNVVTHKIRSTAANAAIPNNDHSTMRQPLFAGHEVCYAFGQVVSHAIDEMCTQTLRVVLLLAYLVDSRPAFLGAATISKIVQLYLPQSITVYQRWRLSQWVVSQGFTQSGVDIEFASPAAITPPLLQMFLLDINGRLNGSDDFKRVLSVLQLASASNYVRSEVVHDVLMAFARDILQCVSPSNDTLMRFLQKHQQFRLLRATLCGNLSDISMHGSWKGIVVSTQHGNEVHNCVRSIGECLAFEGREAAARFGDTINARNHARSCFQQAIRCYSICLTDLLQDRNDCLSLSGKALEQFIYEVVGLLKETVPRGSIDLLLSFLWNVVSEALSYLAQFDGCEPSFAVQSFIWVNVFKYSVEVQLFRDAHLALMHTAELSAAWDCSKSAGDTDDIASECMNYLVKELFRYGHFGLICELHWGSLQPQVETYILWQAGNAAIVQGDSSNASTTRYYDLLFAFYMRNQGLASAASALYAFALRFQLTLSTSKAAFEAQRNALNAACNALQALPPENRWFVHKLHTKRPKCSSLKTPEHAKVVPSTRVVTLEDMKCDLSVLDGKLQLLTLGCSEGMLLSTMDGDEVIALLVDAANTSCHKTRSTTQAERRRAGLHCFEIAADIAGRSPVATMSSLTKSLARYCVNCEHPSISRCDRDFSWELLEMFLVDAGSLEQYEVAAETVLEFWLQEGRKLVLPVWLKQRLSSPSLGNPVLLLGLYLKHGLLLEGLELVESLLLDITTTDRETKQLMFSTHSQVKSSALPFELPWIPYNLVDVLLDSTAAVLSQGVSEDVSHTDVARLREHDHRLRQQLSQHFHSINALQQAQKAKSLARSCSALDT